MSLFNTLTNATKVIVGVISKPVFPKEFEGPWELQIDSYMTGREGVSTYVLHGKVELEYTDGINRWKLTLPVPTGKNKKLNLVVRKGGAE